MLSKLLERAGPRVRVEAIRPNPSGSPVALHLRRDLAQLDRLVTAFHILVTNGVSVRKAKDAIDLLANDEAVALIATKVDNYPAFEVSLSDCGLIVERHAPPEIDVASVRAKFLLTQEQFAARFALGLATVQNWEQGRSVPDGPARSFLAVIDRYPEIAEEVVKARP